VWRRHAAYLLPCTAVHPAVTAAVPGRRNHTGAAARHRCTVVPGDATHAQETGPGSGPSKQAIRKKLRPTGVTPLPPLSSLHHHTHTQHIHLLCSALPSFAWLPCSFFNEHISADCYGYVMCIRRCCFGCICAVVVPSIAVFAYPNAPRCARLRIEHNLMYCYDQAKKAIRDHATV